MKSLSLVVRSKRAKRSHYTPALAITLALSFLAGCAPERVAEIAADAKERELLAFLVDGKTRKDEVLSRLGKPTGTFEDGRILTYRMVLHSEKGFVPFVRFVGLQLDSGYAARAQQGGMQRSHAPTWKGYYQIILVFDAEDAMEKHKILKHKNKILKHRVY